MLFYSGARCASAAPICGASRLTPAVTVTGAKVWLLIGLMVTFGSLIAACWIMVARYVEAKDEPQQPGVLLFMQVTLIFLR
jgi:hypothetical protein